LKDEVSKTTSKTVAVTDAVTVTMATVGSSTDSPIRRATTQHLAGLSANVDSEFDIAPIDDEFSALPSARHMLLGSSGSETEGRNKNKNHKGKGKSKGFYKGKG